MDIGPQRHAHFRRIVQMGGGDIQLLGKEGDTIRIGFVPAETEACESGACVLHRRCTAAPG